MIFVYDYMWQIIFWPYSVIFSNARIAQVYPKTKYTHILLKKHSLQAQRDEWSPPVFNFQHILLFNLLTQISGDLSSIFTRNPTCRCCCLLHDRSSKKISFCSLIHISLDTYLSIILSTLQWIIIILLDFYFFHFNPQSKGSIYTLGFNLIANVSIFQEHKL